MDRRAHIDQSLDWPTTRNESEPPDAGESCRPNCRTCQTWNFGSELAMVFLPRRGVVDYSLRLKKSMNARRLWVNAYRERRAVLHSFAAQSGARALRRRRMR